MSDESIESPELRQYRLQARAWLGGNLPPSGGRENDDDDPTPEQQAEDRRLQALLCEAGYAGFTFPVAYGGQGLSLDHERVFLEEATGYHLPVRMFGVSINILGATLVAFGTHEQKLAHIPNILSGKTRWLQLLSEPSGGSDIGGLLTSARRDGDS
jgi:alkylation response protein AidB-like acyl-CoA dehydrogenase